MFENLEHLIKTIRRRKKLSLEKLIQNRRNKFISMGNYLE